jgi:DNA invertase Pin-like site-specific DNA recombinase
MNICGYLRVSGKGQIDGDGQDRQQDSILAFCAKNNLPSPLFFFEAGVSGTVEALDRPQFAAMLEAKPDCIIVERMDRLARDLMVSEFLLRECRQRHIPVYAADQGDLRNIAEDGGDPTRVLLRQILGAVAEWEKSALVMKLRKARDRKRLETGHCEGPIPFGVTAEEKLAQEEMRMARAQGASFTRIAQVANQLGRRRRDGKSWTKGSVYQVIARQKN